MNTIAKVHKIREQFPTLRFGQLFSILFIKSGDYSNLFNEQDTATATEVVTQWLHDLQYWDADPPINSTIPHEMWLAWVDLIDDRAP